MAENVEELSFTEQVTEQITESPEPENTPESPEPTEEQATNEQVTEPASQPEQTKPEAHNFDKGLQKTQQRLAEIERRYEEQSAALQKKIEELTGYVKPKQPDPLDSLEGDEFASDGTKALVNELRQLRDTVREQQAKIEQYSTSTSNKLGSVETSLAEQRFFAENPELKPKYQDMIQEAQSTFWTDYGDLAQDLNDTARQRLATKVWEQTVAKYKQSLSAPQTTPTIQPKDKPDKPTDGTRVTGKKPAPKPMNTKSRLSSDEFVTSVGFFDKD